MRVERIGCWGLVVRGNEGVLVRRGTVEGQSGGGRKDTLRC